MKRTKTRKLVLTDGTWYFENTSATHSYFTKNPKGAMNFYCERWPDLNDKKTLQWQIDTWTKHEPEVLVNGRVDDTAKIDRNKFVLKWVTIIETVKEEDFNYEGF